MFNIDFKILTETLVAIQLRKPRLLGLLASIVKPLILMYVTFIGYRRFTLRRVRCDGSVMLLEQLLRDEFGLRNVSIVDGYTVATSILTLSVENIGTMCINTIGEGMASTYMSMEGEDLTGEYDYKVLIGEPVSVETLARIGAVVRFYNSVGFSFIVE